MKRFDDDYRFEIPFSDAVGRYPAFIGIGPPKTGTTWIDFNLRRHPDLWLPPIKELNYFNALHIAGQRKWIIQHRRKSSSRTIKHYVNRAPEERWDFGFIANIASIAKAEVNDDWYRSIFAWAPSAKICGEISPEYCLLPAEGIAHILRVSPEVKIIISVRDPIARTWSHIRMINNDNREMTEENILKILEGPRIFQRCDYFQMLKRWQKQLPDDRILIIFMDEITERPTQTMQKLCAYLGVDFHEKYFPDLERRVGAGKPAEIPARVYEEMRRRLRPVYENLADTFPEFGSQWLKAHY